MIPTRTLLLYCIFYYSLTSLSGFGQTDSSRKPVIIRDTDIAEGIDRDANPEPKERNPELAKKEIEAGIFNYKTKNYGPAIKRFLTAIEYQADSVRAYEFLAKAYEKDGKIDKAIDALKDFLKNNPDSKKCSDFRKKLAELEEKLPRTVN